MRAILDNWSLMRVFRLMLGIIVLVQAYIQKDTTIGLLAGFLLLTSIANIRCCGANACGINFKQNKK